MSDRRQGPILLAIDTATAICGVALFDGKLLAETVWQAGQEHTTTLLKTVLWLLDRQGLTADDVGAIGVSQGPGSFNGLRVGISTAKGLAFARDLPCLGISTLEATAFQHAVAGYDIRPLYEAGRGEVATALYRIEEGALRQLEGPRLSTTDAIGAQIVRPTIVCGEVREDWCNSLSDRVGDMVSFPPASGRVRRPSYLAELAWRRAQDGERGDVITLQPLYLRRPAITTPKTH